MNSMDKRCCGSGTCIINEAGECWCGQKWDGDKMIPGHASFDTGKDESFKLPSSTDPEVDQKVGLKSDETS
jgi:hypothetical protein